MKSCRSLITSLLAPLPALLSVVAVQAAGPTPTVVGNDFDFGLIRPNSTYRHQVWLKAPESDSVRIQEIMTGCGCTSFLMSDSSAAPGDSVGIVILWQTRGSIGNRNESLLLKTDLELRPQEIKWRGQVVTESDSTASLSWEPWYVHFEASANKRSPEAKEVLLRSFSELELNPVVVEQGPEYELDSPGRLAPHGAAILTLGLKEAYIGVNFESSVTLLLNGNSPEAYRVSIPVAGGDYSYRPEFITKTK